jgi:hypothetical protein
MMIAVRLRSLIPSLILVGIAAELTKFAATRNGVGPFEYVTVGALVALLLYWAFRLARGASRHASA